MSVSPWHIGVLIPARNEELLLPRCLRSVMVARSCLPSSVTCEIVVAVDSSSDRTRELAEQLVGERGVVVSTQVGIVGRARALAAHVALARYRGLYSHCWLANTDADCVVPASWLTDQLALAQNHVEAFAGVVDVDTFEEHDRIVAERFRATYSLPADGSHPHVHAANLGIRADVYLQAGGWSPIPTAEDHDLWNRVRNRGARTASLARIKVLTSGRRVGRAPHGFAEALAAHNETAA